MKLRIVALVLLLLSLSHTSWCWLAAQVNVVQSNFKFADSLYYSNPDSAFVYYQQLFRACVAAKDTLGQLKCLQRMGSVHLGQNEIPEAMNYYSEALHLANRKKEMANKASILGKLGNVYCKFGQLKTGGDYIYQAHNLLLRCMKEKNIDDKPLVFSYSNVAELERRKGNNITAMRYIDTCLWLAQRYKYSYSESAHMLRIKATVFSAMDSVKQALAILLPLDKHFDAVSLTQSNNSNYYSNSILVSASVGKIYAQQGNNKAALHYLFKSLNLTKRLQKKTDNQLFVLNQIANIYHQQKKYKLAFEFKAKAYNYTQANLRPTSKRNRGVLKIRNGYIERIEEKEKEILAMNLALANKTKANLRLRISLLVVLFSVAFGALWYWSSRQRRKLLYEQKQLQQQAAAQEKVSKLELSYKQRELTTYSLQLLERDELLDKFVQYISAQKDAEAKSLKHARTQLTTNLWEEFEKRFVNIHEGFYERLKEACPALTVNDLKFCALVKLNLKGKEISRLLGMTEASVHTARYRIRKKLALETNASLEEFMKQV